VNTEDNISYAGYDYGPLRTYEIIWKSGHVDTVQGHQVTFGADVPGFTIFPGRRDAVPQASRVKIYGQFGPHWRMVLYALEDDISTIRDVTGQEKLA